MLEEKYVVFHIQGGLGKNVAATAIIKSIHKKYSDRKLIVVSPYPEIFLNNPYLWRAYKLGNTEYFYDDYINGKDVVVLKREPYDETQHILKQSNLIKTWHDVYELEYNEKDCKPELYMNMMQEKLASSWQKQKPILLIQTNGGPFPKNSQTSNYSWTRDMPPHIIEEVAKVFSKDYHIIQICRENSLKLKGAEIIDYDLSNFDLFSLIKASSKRLFIDSCMQHAAAAFGLKSTVLWIGTHPNVFGYNVHNNIVANPPLGNTKLMSSYLFDYALSGTHQECPYSDMMDIFDTKTIIDSVIKN
jgi:uncharacterized phage-like protein YoqJ